MTDASLPSPNERNLELRPRIRATAWITSSGCSFDLSYVSRTRPFPPRGCSSRALLQSHRHAQSWCYESEGKMP